MSASLEFKLAENLGLFLRQKVWLGLVNQASYSNQLLKVSIVEDEFQSEQFCPVSDFKLRAAGAAIQEVPMCTGITARVERDMSVNTGQDFVNKEGLETLYIGFLYMSADGSIYTNSEVGFDGGPMDVKLTKFDISLGKAQPPVGSLEHIMIVGTSEPFGASW